MPFLFFQLTALFAIRLVDRILQGQVPLAVVVCTVHYDQHSPCFNLQYAAQVRNDNSTLSALETCVVQWARDDTPLKAGDR
jgi:hypothetical protein